MIRRTRSKEKRVPGGTAIQFSVNFTRRNFLRRTDWMVDYWQKDKDLYGLLPSSTLDHRVSISQPVRLSGVAGSTKAFGLICSAINAADISIPASHSAKDRGNTAYLNRLLNETNPFRSEYSIPVGIRELAELATLFSLAAKTFAGFLGGAYLNYRFGWKAFARDLKVLANIVDAVRSRILEFRSIQLHGGLRRSVLLDSYSTDIPSGSTWILNSAPSPLSVYASQTYTYRTKVYGSVRWFPAPGAYTVLDDVTPLEEFSRAVNTVLGLEHFDLSTLWELLPWSWLIDYFWELGPYLGATSRSNIVSPEYICLTRKSIFNRIGTVYSKPSGISVTGSPRITTYRTLRSVHSGADFPTSLSVLTLSEAKVITALFLKFRG